MRKLTFREIQAAEMSFSKARLMCAGGRPDPILHIVPDEELMVENAHHLSWSEGSPSPLTRWGYPGKEK